MTGLLREIRIDADRLKTDFDALAKIGCTGDGGVHRPALGEEHLAARAWFRDQVEATGLEFKIDGAGNHSAFLACSPQGSTTLLLGSHLDSVSRGGNSTAHWGYWQRWKHCEWLKLPGKMVGIFNIILR